MCPCEAAIESLTDGRPAARPPLLAVGLLSGVALAYEVLLTRLFAIIQWHHFAAMVISLALLGYGASGSFLTLAGGRLQRVYPWGFVLNAVAFALSLVAAVVLAQRLPFNPLEIAWDRSQLLYLLALYLLLAVPFFCVANCVALSLARFHDDIPRIYGMDLLGAGLGALGVVVLLLMLSPAGVLRVLGLLAAAAALLAVLESRWPPLLSLGGVAALLCLALVPQSWLELHLSPYKDLSQASNVAGARLLAQRHSPLGRVDVMTNEQVPLRYAPGLSLNSPALPPFQLGLYLDGGFRGAITQFDGRRQSLAYLDWVGSALPYHLIRPRRVLVLQSGGGDGVLQALYHGAGGVEAVEPHPQVVDLLQERFAGFVGGLYQRPGVTLHQADVRGFLRSTDRRYDLIQLTLLDDPAGSAGLQSLNESYLYTREAFAGYLERLAPGGMLAVTYWLKLPPRDGLKLLLTAARALESAGVPEPARQLVLIRGFKAGTLLMRKGAFTAGELQSVRAFCRERSLDVAWYPGIQESETNTYNRLEAPFMYRGAMALLGEQRETFLDDYKFQLQPATDDRPFFLHFFRWRTLPELLSLRAAGGLAQLEWGYLVLLATLVQALVLGIGLIVLPLWLARRIRHALPRQDRHRVLLYFTAVGLGFLLLEIAYIQRFILYLSHPLYAVAVVLSAFLIFAGLGSQWAARLNRWGPVPPLLGILVLALLYLLVLPWVFQHTLVWADPWRVAVAVGLIAPLALCMGMPFPLGLIRLHPDTLPWAWAINGCASVLAAVLATVLAMDIGFSGVVLVAAACYLLALSVRPRRAAP